MAGAPICVGPDSKPAAAVKDLLPDNKDAIIVLIQSAAKQLSLWLVLTHQAAAVPFSWELHSRVPTPSAGLPLPRTYTLAHAGVRSSVGKAFLIGTEFSCVRRRRAMGPFGQGYDTMISIGS